MFIKFISELVRSEASARNKATWLKMRRCDCQTGVILTSLAVQSLRCEQGSHEALQSRNSINVSALVAATLEP